MDDQISTHGFAFVENRQMAVAFQVRYPGFGLGERTDYETAMLCLTESPFSELEIWNGHSWEVVFNGAVEFAGVAPERE